MNVSMSKKFEQIREDLKEIRYQQKPGAVRLVLDVMIAAALAGQAAAMGDEDHLKKCLLELDREVTPLFEIHGQALD